MKEIKFIRSVENELDITISSGALHPEIYITLSRSASTGDINVKTVKKALALVSSYETFSCRITGRGAEVDGYETRHTTLASYRVEREVYRGIELFVLYWSCDIMDIYEPTAHRTLEEALEVIISEVAKTLAHREHDFRYIASE